MTRLRRLLGILLRCEEYVDLVVADLLRRVAVVVPLIVVQVAEPEVKEIVVKKKTPCAMVVRFVVVKKACSSGAFCDSEGRGQRGGREVEREEVW